MQEVVTGWQGRVRVPASLIGGSTPSAPTQPLVKGGERMTDETIATNLFQNIVSPKAEEAIRADERRKIGGSLITRANLGLSAFHAPGEKQTIRWLEMRRIGQALKDGVGVA